ncbi:MAG: HAMP domain-containing protein [Streptococcaceae bacterium]|jgi:signal transduction histidine kinase|nr:HAMP domain-containing protein [Streptococcaceae bacterium]
MSEKKTTVNPLNKSLSSFREFSITTRLLLVNISIVLVAFVGVLVVFNVLMSSYITSSATKQISTVAHFPESSARSSSSSSSLPNLENAPVGRFNTRSMVFKATSTYTIENAGDLQPFDLQTAKTILTGLKEDGTSLSGLKSYRLETGESTFYIQTVADDGSYLIYYTDISGIVNFSDKVNAYLVWITLAVLIFTSLSILLTTRRITQPLGRLAGFARRIGKGDFTRDDRDYHGRELKVLASNLNDAATQLSEKDTTQKTFFQNASHELRTPLMTIKSYAEGISYDVMAPKDAATTILKETDNMTELVEDLLTTSRLDSLGTTDGEELLRQDLRELVKDVAAEQTPLAEKQGLELSCEFPKKAVLREINYKAMRRAVANLVSNAIRYAKSRVTLAVSPEGVISVRNDGPAITPEDLPHIFERFYKGKGGVHGIGLAIVKAIAQQHHGELSVTSDETETTFKIDMSQKI